MPTHDLLYENNDFFQSCRMSKICANKGQQTNSKFIEFSFINLMVGNSRELLFTSLPFRSRKNKLNQHATQMSCSGLQVIQQQLVMKKKTSRFHTHRCMTNKITVNISSLDFKYLKLLTTQKKNQRPQFSWRKLSFLFKNFHFKLLTLQAIAPTYKAICI